MSDYKTQDRLINVPLYAIEAFPKLATVTSVK